MAYIATQLISGAFYKSGIVAREFGTVSGSQVAVGLDELNKALADKTVAEHLIPYYSQYNFNTVAGQEAYVIPELIDVSTLTFAIGTIRFSLDEMQRDNYFGSSRANNVGSLPYVYHFEPAFGGGTLYLYFIPNTVYVMELWGKFRLSSVTLMQDLSLSLDLFYIDFLETLLAKRLCNEYNFSVPQGVEESLTRMYTIFKNQVAPLDTTMNKVSTLQNRGGIDGYGDANLGKGWRPPAW